MKKIILLAFAFCGIQAATAQTVTPAPTERKQHSAVPSDKQKMDNSRSDKKMEKKSGSTGTYTTGAEVPDNIPADTASRSNGNPKPGMESIGKPKE